MGEGVLVKAGKDVYVGICINLICVCWDEVWIVVAVVVLLLLLLAKLAGMNLRIIFSWWRVGFGGAHLVGWKIGEGVAHGRLLGRQPGVGEDVVGGCSGEEVVDNCIWVGSGEEGEGWGALV